MLNQQQKDQWFSWLYKQAIPLWSKEGFDEKSGLFHERLTFDGKPCDPDVIRVMAQMRQISCFASISTWSCFDLVDRERWLELAAKTFKNVTSLYKEADGKPGWVFGLNLKTKEINSDRDLYAHAFVLFAHAKLGQAYAHFKKTDLFNELRTQSMKEMEEIQKLFHLSFLKGSNNLDEIEFIPTKDEHEQNPYMHLLEASIELFKAFKDPEYLSYARRIVEFLLPKFQSSKGLVIELFDQEWKPADKPGSNRVEVGHLFEWSWLLAEFSQLDSSTDLGLGKVQSTFSTFGLKNGICKRRSVIWDGVLESGKDKVQTSRMWPQTEFLRWACTQSKADEELTKFANKVNNKLFKSWFLDDLKGGWCDRLNKDGVNTTEWMPATSFYHVLATATVILSGK